MEKKQTLWEKYRTDILVIAVFIIMAIKAVDWSSALEGFDTHMKELIDREKIEKQRADSLQTELDSLHVLSWENVEYWIDTLGIEHPEIVKQQIALETGMLTSAICLENSNLFGMKEPRVRETTALGTQRGHAYYHNYIDSIKDYKLWQDNMYDGGDYYAFLHRVGYAEANHYIAALKTI